MGTAVLSEKDGASYLSDNATSVDHCPEGFGLHSPARSADLPSFYCTDHPEQVVS